MAIALIFKTSIYHQRFQVLAIMNVLLLNLTRFGDLMQTQAAVTDLVRLGHSVGVVCLENFAQAARLLSGVSHVAPLRGASLLAALGNRQTGDETPVQPNWPQALASLACWRDELETAFAPDHICNLTPSLPARLLALFLSRQRRVSGFTVDAQGFGVNAGSWAAFLQGAAAERGVSPFNVTDLFRKIARDLPGDNPSSRPAAFGPGDASLLQPPEDARNRMLDRLMGAAPQGHNGFVAFQMGASENRRRWPVASFAALGEGLWGEAGLCPVLLGSGEEAELAGRYAEAASHPFIDLSGKTGFEDLACVLCAARLLVTNDTGTMHLAAGLKVPLASVFLATAQPFDTGPYLEGSCSLEPDMDCHPCAFGMACPRQEVCRKAILPGFMLRLILGYLQHGRWEVPKTAEAPVPGVRVWESAFDDAGFMGLVSLSGHESSARTSWLGLQRHYIRCFLDRERAAAFTPPLLSHQVFLPEDMRREVSSVTTQAAALVDLMVRQGGLFAAQGLELMRERFLSSWQKVYGSLRQSPYFAALALLWAQETQAEGQDLPSVLAAAEQFGQLLSAIEAELVR